MALPPISPTVKHASVNRYPEILYRDPDSIDLQRIQVMRKNWVDTHYGVYYPEPWNSNHELGDLRLRLIVDMRNCRVPSNTWESYVIKVKDINPCLSRFMKQLYDVINKQTPQSFPPIRQHNDNLSFSIMGYSLIRSEEHTSEL